MGIRENKALITTYYAVINGESDEQLADYFDENISWHLPPAHPYGGPYTGKQNVMQMLGAGIGMYTAGTIKVHSIELIAEADNVVAHFQIDASLADGTPYHNEYLFRFVIQNGCIATVWEFLDTYYLFSMGMFANMQPS